MPLHEIQTSLTPMCPEGERLARMYHNLCVYANGDCTSLYYHIQECDECEELRQRQLLKLSRL